MKPSKFHHNIGLDNWLVYNISDEFLKKYSKYYQGVLVDLGCRETPYKEYFLKFVDKYIGIDCTNSLHNIKVDIVSDLNKKINLPDETANTIISLSVMKHLYNPQQFLNESNIILKKGVMILQVPWQWLVQEASHYYFRYTPYGLEYLFRQAGFKDIVVEAQSGFFTMWLLKINYFSSRFIRGPKFLRVLIKSALIQFWTLNQLIAPILDKLLDRNWKLESSGYFVVARRI